MSIKCLEGPSWEGFRLLTALDKGAFSIIVLEIELMKNLRRRKFEWNYSNNIVKTNKF